jgi:hypothetical protein
MLGKKYTNEKIDFKLSTSLKERKHFKSEDNFWENKSSTFKPTSSGLNISFNGYDNSTKVNRSRTVFSMKNERFFNSRATSKLDFKIRKL